MKKIIYSPCVIYFVLSCLSLFGCSEAKIENTHIPVMEEIDPSSDFVRLWLCSKGNFAYDDETCQNGIFPITDPKRFSIQTAIKARFPNYKITKISRTTEKAAYEKFTVFYVSIKKIDNKKQ